MTINVGQPVIYVDENGVAHDALVNQVWMEQPSYTDGKTDHDKPGINLVRINPDSTMDDQYGRQLLRETSVVHKKYQPANGRYWLKPEEHQ